MRPKSKTELAMEFGISYKTFIRWIQDVPDLKLRHRQRLFSPKQVLQIYEHFGKPEKE